MPKMSAFNCIQVSEREPPPIARRACGNAGALEGSDVQLQLVGDPLQNALKELLFQVWRLKPNADPSCLKSSQGVPLPAKYGKTNTPRDPP